MTQPKSGADLLKKIQPTRNRGRTQLCLRSDLVDKLNAADEALAEEIAATPARLAGQGASLKVTAKQRKLAQEVADLEQAVEDASIWFEMESIDADRWQEIADEHPPRPGNQVDGWLGWNADAVADAAMRESLLDPVFEECHDEECDHKDCGTWEALRKKMNGSEWGELRDLCREVNQKVAVPPKSPLASEILAAPSTGSARRGRGTQARVASTGGSRKKSTSSSTETENAV